MKFKTYSALLGALIVAAPFNAAAVSMDNVKAALHPGINQNDGQEVTDSAIKESLVKLNLTSATWTCFAINQLLSKNALTKGCTTRVGAFGLPYVRTLSLDGVAKNAKKLVMVKEESGAVVCGIIFTVDGTSCKSNYVDAATAKNYCDTFCVAEDRGLTTIQYIPEAYCGPLRTVVEWTFSAAKWAVIAYAFKKYGEYSAKWAVEAALAGTK